MDQMHTCSVTMKQSIHFSVKMNANCTEGSPEFLKVQLIRAILSGELSKLVLQNEFRNHPHTIQFKIIDISAPLLTTFYRSDIFTYFYNLLSQHLV